MECNKIICFPKAGDKAADRLDCLATFCWYKRLIRNTCLAMEVYEHRTAKLKRKKNEIEQGDHQFNHYRISIIDEKLADLEAWRGYYRAELVKVGEQVYHALHHADDLLSFHDKCQVLGRDHRGVARQMKRDEIPDGTTFSDMVNVYNLEYRGKSDILPIYSSELPLYTAFFVFFTHEMIHNRELHDMSGEMFNEIFSDVPWAELRIDHRGKEYMHRLPPRLQLV